MRINYLFIFISLSLNLSGQIYKDIRIDTITSTFRINPSNQEIYTYPPSFDSAQGANPLFQKIALNLENYADLSFRYQLITLEENFRYEPIKLIIFANNRPVIIPNINKRQVPESLSKNHYGSFIIKDAMEHSLLYEEDYELMVIGRLKGIQNEISCMNGKPKFSLKFKDKWPYYTAAAVGTPLLLYGIFSKESDNNYSNYKVAWQEGESGDAALRHLDNANRTETWRVNLLRAGSVLVISSIGGLAYRYFVKHKPKVRKYKKYCRS